MNEEVNKYDQSIYDYYIYRYKALGDDIAWEIKDRGYTKIKDINDVDLKNILNTLRQQLSSPSRLAWIYIFESEQLIRRLDKINKIKCNLNVK